LASHPGKSNSASNQPIHALIRKCGESTATKEQLDTLLKIIPYREGVGGHPQALRDVMGLENFPHSDLAASSILNSRPFQFSLRDSDEFSRSDREKATICQVGFSIKS
jgi:hypothetical protein